jgi:ectoine hydroxylase-related dioxygenase (phytanoyl-CoA dioxygenase family)
MPHAKMIAHDPKDGDILLFPSYLLHEVSVNTSAKNRITVGFNIKLDLQDPSK